MKNHTLHLKKHNKSLEKGESNTTPDFIDEFFKMHMEAVELNKSNPFPHANRYPEECKPFYVLISFVGKYWYDFLSLFMHLPCYSRTKDYRRELFEKYNLRSYNALDGSIELINTLKDSLWNSSPDKTPDMRCVLAIDAASVNPQVCISKDGTVIGFTSEGPQSVSVEKAAELRDKIKELEKLIAE